MIESTALWKTYTDKLPVLLIGRFLIGIIPNKKKKAILRRLQNYICLKAYSLNKNGCS